MGAQVCIRSDGSMARFISCPAQEKPCLNGEFVSKGQILRSIEDISLAHTRTHNTNRHRRDFFMFTGVVLVGIFLFLFASHAQAQSRGASIIRDSEIETMLREWSDPIFEAAGLNPSAVSIYIISDFSMNAFVTGGQNVFFHTGIIVAADTPNELKGVIAHETGHIAGAHLARFQDGSRQAMVPMFLSLAAGLLAAAAGEGQAGAALIASSQQFGMLELFQYTQAQESAADQAAIQFLEKTGQSGRGLIRFFERFEDQDLWRESRDPYFRTHPLSRARVADLQNPVAAQQFVDEPDTPENIERLKRVQAKIFGFLASPRRVFALYPDEDQSIYALYARSVAHHRVGSRDLAISHIEQLLALEPENPYFLELLGQIHFENGKAEEAIAPYRAAIARKPDDVLFRIGLAQALLNRGGETGISAQRLDEAEDLLIFVATRERNNALAWMLRSTIFEQRGLRAHAQWAVAEARMITGAYPEAYQRARVALEGLTEGTVEHRRAQDIVRDARNQEAVQRALREGRR
jgi:predicted Zn-dependent protease